MDGFVSRAAELAALQRWWDEGHPVAALWGRRRVGKTTLASRFADDRHAVFHTGAGRGDVGELRLLAERVAAALPGGAVERPPEGYGGWSDAFDDIRDRAVGRDVLLVLDDVADLLADTAGLPAALRTLVAEGRRDLRVMVISSRVRQMDALQQARRPMHRLAGLTLVLQPFTPHEVAGVLDRLSPPDRARVYSVVGGIPLYLSWWDQDAGMVENVERLVCRPGAGLLTEGDLLLGADLEDLGFNDRVLHALADGRASYNDVRDWAGTEPARPLDRLIELHLIERVLPVGESRQARRRRYRITDPFVGFFLGVVSPRRSEIDRGRSDGLAEALVAAAEHRMGDVWVEAFRGHLRALASSGELPVAGDARQVGPWWDNTGRAEIDALVLAEGTGEPVLAGAATWLGEPDAVGMLTRLRRKVERGLGAYPDRLRYALCSPEPVRDLPYDVLGFTAADLFGDQPSSPAGAAQATPVPPMPQ